MKRVEKLILVMVAFLFLSRIGALLKEILYAYSVGAAGPTPQQTVFFKNISFILSILVNVGSSIWLYIESKKAALKTWVWCLFGLFLGLMAVIIFYLHGIYDKMRIVENHSKE